jgi:hypothetical protein
MTFPIGTGDFRFGERICCTGIGDGTAELREHVKFWGSLGASSFVLDLLHAVNQPHPKILHALYFVRPGGSFAFLLAPGLPTMALSRAILRKLEKRNQAASLADGPADDASFPQRAHKVHSAETADRGEVQTIAIAIAPRQYVQAGFFLEASGAPRVPGPVPPRGGTVVVAPARAGNGSAGGPRLLRKRELLPGLRLVSLTFPI